MTGVRAGGGRSCSWWVISAQCVGGLALYVTTSLSVGLLSGSAVLGAIVSGLVVLCAVALWRRRAPTRRALSPLRRTSPGSGRSSSSGW
ncbi:hypothetical protein ACWFMI_02285 [Nocardiopsis terrae]